MESAYHALHLLLDQSPKVTTHAETLERLNSERRAFVKQSVEEAMALVGATEQVIIIVSSPNWHPGVNGLIASGLLEHYSRPVIVLSEKEGIHTASARSIPGFNIVEHITALSHFLHHFGGHPQAAGFSLSSDVYSLFKAAMEERARQALTPEQFVRTLTIDYTLPLTELTWDTFALLSQFAPFGLGNPTPRLLLRNVTGYVALPLGQEGKHLKLLLPTLSEEVEAVGFGLGPHLEELSTTPPLDLVVTLKENVWNGRRKLQAVIEDGQCSSLT
jgi:single-stranded-DNA-specific exonuclease